MNFEKFPIKKPEKKEALPLEPKTFTGAISKELKIPEFSKESELPKEAPKSETPYLEYLRRTGEGELELMNLAKQGPLWIELRDARERGDREQVKKLQEEIRPLVDESINRAIEGIIDVRTSLDIQNRMPSLTGDIKTDAQAFFQMLGAKRALDTLSKGADPAGLLKSYAEMADSILDRAKEGEAVKRATYTLIIVKRMAEEILSTSAQGVRKDTSSKERR